MSEKIPKSQQKAVNNYIRKNYDRIELIVPKGHKAIIKAAADSVGESVGMFIRKSIEGRIEGMSKR